MTSVLVYGIAWNAKDNVPRNVASILEDNSSPGILHGTHGDAKFPMYYIGTWARSASRGTPVCIELPIAPEESDDALKDFCAKYGLPFKPPCFNLLAYTE